VGAEVHTNIRLRIPFFGDEEDFHRSSRCARAARRLSIPRFAWRWTADYAKALLVST